MVGKEKNDDLSKEEIYQNIFEMINNGFFLNKYIELTSDYNLDGLDAVKRESVIKELEEISANIFNAILIACQLFHDEERRNAFANFFSNGIDITTLSIFLPRMFNMSEEEACEKLKNGFGVHFTTCKICEEINKSNGLVGYGKNAMFTKEEDELIKEAERLQIQNNPEDMNKLNYLFRGWGTGVSSYSSITNGFWMYHTPESLSFLFGNISSRNKERAMQNVLRRTSNLDKETQVRVLQTMSNIWDRLIGNEQEVGCILIDRDAFEYEKDTYYNNGRAEVRERRPYSKGLNSINDNDCKINKNIDLQHMKFLKLPTIIKLEALKKEMFEKNVPHGK